MPSPMHDSWNKKYEWGIWAVRRYNAVFLRIVNEKHQQDGEVWTTLCIIAIATMNGMDALVTWNFRHLNNPFTRTRVRRIIEQAGYQAPEICSPEEFTGEAP